MSIDNIFNENTYSNIRQTPELLSEIRKVITGKFRSFDREKVRDAYSEALTKWEEHCILKEFWGWSRDIVVGWLFVTTNNNLINDYRGQKNRRKAEQTFLTFGTDPSSSVSLEEFREIFSEKFLNYILKNHPPIRRSIFIAYLQGQSIKDIAELHQIQPRTVWTYVIRFKKDLKKTILSSVKSIS